MTEKKLNGKSILPKYLVRPSDYAIYELYVDENGHAYYIGYLSEKDKDGPRYLGNKHFTYDLLTDLGSGSFFPITESKIEYYEDKNAEYWVEYSRTHRNDGHGGIKIID
jgi:hypothetical protein